jgi:hypothetical protein
VSVGWTGALEGWISTVVDASGVSVGWSPLCSTSADPIEGRKGVAEVKPVFEMRMLKVGVGVAVQLGCKFEMSTPLPKVSVPTKETTNSKLTTHTQRGTTLRTRLRSSSLSAPAICLRHVLTAEGDGVTDA